MEANNTVIPISDIPFYYEFLLEEEIPKDQQQSVLRILDQKISAAKKFLGYLDGLEKSNISASKVNLPEYTDIQDQFSMPLVHGEAFLKLNSDYNHAKFEIEDIKKKKAKLEESVKTAITQSEEDRKKFHDAVKQLEVKSGQINGASLAKVQLPELPALTFHLEKVCGWIMDIYYDTPSSKFEWANFRKNVFTSDNAVDFKNRIKGLYIPKLYDYQIETCQYVLSTRPMFMKHWNNQVWDTVLSTAEEVIRAYEARTSYTNNKKLISESKTKSIAAKIDIDQSDKVAKTTEPYIQTIYSKVIESELAIRAINLSDFQTNNKAHHLFFKGSGGRVAPLLREDALANYGKEQAPAGKDAKKAGKAMTKTEQKPLNNDVKPSQNTQNTNGYVSHNKEQQQFMHTQPNVQTSPLKEIPKGMTVDPEFEMPELD